MGRIWQTVECFQLAKPPQLSYTSIIYYVFILFKKNLSTKRSNSAFKQDRSRVNMERLSYNAAIQLYSFIRDAL